MKNILPISSVLVALVMASPVLAQDLQPDSANCVLNVQVLNERGTVNLGDTISFQSGDDGEVFTGVTNDKGQFSVKIPNGRLYKSAYKDMNGEMQSSELDLPGNQLLVINWELMFELPRVYTLDNVFFDTGKSLLRPESFKELDELVEVMIFKGEMVVEIGGHTDDVGEADANMKLSQQRAESVRNYLIKKDVKELHVKAKGYGESKPIAHNDTAEGRQKNRRTEVKILSR